MTVKYGRFFTLLWYSLGIWMKKKVKNFTLKKGYISGLAQIGMQNLPDVLQHPVLHSALIAGLHEMAGHRDTQCKTEIQRDLSCSF